MATREMPKRFTLTKQRHPALVRAVEAVGEAAHAEGPIDGKTAQLIQLAAAVAIRSEGATHSHTRRAHERGATEEEVRQAVLLLPSTSGWPGVGAGRSGVDEALEQRP